MIKVLLADDHGIVRAGLRRLVEESKDIAVVAEAADGREAIKKVHQTRPDVAVVDISMPGMDGLEFISQLRCIYPQLPIIILTMYEEEQYVVRAIEAGAMGYLTKRSAPEQLVKAIRRVFAGYRYLTDEASELLALRVARGAGGRSSLDILPIVKLPNPIISVLKPWIHTACDCLKNSICETMPSCPALPSRIVLSRRDIESNYLFLSEKF